MLFRIITFSTISYFILPPLPHTGSMSMAHIGAVPSDEPVEIPVSMISLFSIIIFFPSVIEIPLRLALIILLLVIKTLSEYL